MRRILSALALVTIFCATAWAQSDSKGDFRSEPGYVDLSIFAEVTGGEETVEIHLTQPLLSIAKWAVQEEDPELAEMLGSLKLLHVNVYSFEPGSEKSLSGRVEEVSGQLEALGWERIVKVNKTDERWDIHVKMDEAGGTDGAPKFHGLVIVGMGGEDADMRYGDGNEIEAVFVNVVGDLDFAQLSKLGQHFDIPALEHMDDDDRDEDGSR